MSIFPKLLFNFLATNKVVAGLPAWLTSFIARVTGDGGTLRDEGHTVEAYNNTSPYSPTVIQPCDTGKPTVLYNIEPASPDFAVSRLDDKYVLGSGGTIVPVVVNDPAIEFNTDGSFRGLLVEPFAKNVCLQSEDFTTTWSTVNLTVTTNATTAPDGNTTADKLVGSGSGAPGQMFVYQNIGVSASTTYTASVFLKADQLAFARLLAPDYDGFTTGSQFFGLSGDGILGTATGGLDDSSITKYPDGWYRCSITFTTGAGISIFQFRIILASAIGSDFIPVDNTKSIYVWGAQIEASRTATSYIPTTTTPVDRVKDEIELTGASSLIGQTEGTLYVEVDWKTISGTIQYLLDVSNGTTGSRVLIYNFNGILRMYAKATTTGDLFNQGVPSTAFTGVQRFAFAYKTNDFELYRNGSSVSTNTSGSLSTLVLNQINIGTDYIGAYQSNMWIRSVALYNTRLSAADMEALTKGDGYFVGVNEDVFGTSNVTFSER